MERKRDAPLAGDWPGVGWSGTGTDRPRYLHASRTGARASIRGQAGEATEWRSAPAPPPPPDADWGIRPQHLCAGRRRRRRWGSQGWEFGEASCCWRAAWRGRRSRPGRTRSRKHQGSGNPEATASSTRVPGPGFDSGVVVEMGRPRVGRLVETGAAAMLVGRDARWRKTVTAAFVLCPERRRIGSGHRYGSSEDGAKDSRGVLRNRDSVLRGSGGEPGQETLRHHQEDPTCGLSSSRGPGGGAFALGNTCLEAPSSAGVRAIPRSIARNVGQARARRSLAIGAAPTRSASTIRTLCTGARCSARGAARPARRSTPRAELCPTRAP